MDFYQVSTTINGADAAAGLARSAVAARKAACGQVVGPITSVYWWEGRIDDAQEWLVLLKTSAAQVDALIEHIASEHAYDVPEIISTPIAGGHPAYLAWISEQTSP
jgi:periplasmic divalent cation tolerance protein